MSVLSFGILPFWKRHFNSKHFSNSPEYSHWALNFHNFVISLAYTVLQTKLLGILTIKRKANKFSVKSANWIRHLFFYNWDFRVMLCPFQQTKNSSRCSNACKQSYHSRKGIENCVFQGCLSSPHLHRSKEKKLAKPFSCPAKFLLKSCA